MSDHINTSKIQSVEINAQSYYIDGEDIGEGILPRLVHRVSLHPIYDDDTNTIVENQYFTLHNDAGDLMYASKFLQGDSSFQSIVNSSTIIEDLPVPPPVPPQPYPPYPWPIPDGVPVPVPDDEDDDNQWVILPVVIPSGPYGPGPTRPRRSTTRRPKTKRVNPKPKPPTKNTNSKGVTRYIDCKYTNLTLKKIPSKDQRDWDNMRVYSAQKTFEGTEITYINHPWSQLRRGYKMFYNCTKLRRINTKTRFHKLIDGSQMFEGCTILLGFFMDAGSSAYGNHLDLSNLRTAVRMFAECPNLPHVYFYLPNVENTSAMFLNDTSLTVVDIDYQGNAPKNKKAISMYEGCTNLITLSAKAVFQNSLEDASYMFWDCTSFSQFPVTQMGMLKYAPGMFYNCTSLQTIDCEFPSLENASSMYQGSGVTSFNPNGYIKVTNGKQMFANCTLDNVDINFPALTNGQNMFRNCGITHINSINLPSLENGAGMFAGCRLDRESALKVVGIASSVASITNYITMGVNSSLMNDASFRAACNLPEQVPSYAATSGEMAYLDEAQTKAIGIFWT